MVSPGGEPSLALLGHLSDHKHHFHILETKKRLKMLNHMIMVWRAAERSEARLPARGVCAAHHNQ
jgi:hypothetical protein